MEKAGKLTYIAHNYNLLNAEALSEMQPERLEAMEEGDETDAEEEVIDFSQLVKEKEAEDETNEFDDDDLPLSTMLCTK